MNVSRILQQTEVAPQEQHLGPREKLTQIPEGPGMVGECQYMPSCAIIPRRRL